MKTNFRRTIILGYKKDIHCTFTPPLSKREMLRNEEYYLEKGKIEVSHIPIIECVPRKDCNGLKFYCVFCNKWHLHGEGEGHRVAHCHKKTNQTYQKSPFDETGYILKLKKGVDLNGN
jgi:hypothetical protein